MSVQTIGQAVRREEHPRLLKGRGRYVDDIKALNEARGHVLRSPHAHARIQSIDTGQASALPGMLAILVGDDLGRRGLGALRPLVPRKRRDGLPAFVCPQPATAEEGVARNSDGCGQQGRHMTRYSYGSPVPATDRDRAEAPNSCG